MASPISLNYIHIVPNSIFTKNISNPFSLLPGLDKPEFEKAFMNERAFVTNTKKSLTLLCHRFYCHLLHA